MRLLRTQPKFGGDPFRIQWTQPLENGKKPCGVCATMAAEPDARKRFEQPCAEARKAGWKGAPITFRSLVLKPIPRPGKAARA